MSVRGDPTHHELLAAVSRQLMEFNAASDHLLLTRWRVVGLCQHLVGAGDAGVSRQVIDALRAFAREGPTRSVAEMIVAADRGLVGAGQRRRGSALPIIAPEVHADVLERLDTLSRDPTDAIRRALSALPESRRRLSAMPGGALLAGIAHRLELVGQIVQDVQRPLSDRARAAGAVLYFEEVEDSIPDSLGYLGLLDDDFALRTVLAELSDLPSDQHLHWSERVSALWEDLPFLQGVHLMREGEPLVTTWLDRLNSYVSCSHAFESGETPLVLVQPSVACSPLHTVVSLIGLLVLDAVTSAVRFRDALRRGKVYEIDGTYFAEFAGVLDGPPAPGWLRLRFRDGNVYRPPTLARRMVEVPPRRLSSAKQFGRDLAPTDGDPIQQFFDWSDAIGAASISARIVLVSSRQRAEELLGGVASNGVSLLGDGLVQFVGTDPSLTVIRGCLIVVAPSLTAARELVEQGLEVHALLVDGYQRLQRGRHDLPFLLMGKSPPPVITWSQVGYYPSEPPNWLPEHRRLELRVDEIPSVLELDGDLDETDSLVTSALWEAATASPIETILVEHGPGEERVLGAISEFIELLRSPIGLPDYWRYHLFASATTQRELVSATAGYWSDIRAFGHQWHQSFQEQWAELRRGAASQFAPLVHAIERIVRALESVTDDSNKKAVALKDLLEDRPEGQWRILADRAIQIRVLGRYLRGERLAAKATLLRDLEPCEDVVVVGYQSKSFAQRLRAHTPTKTVALVAEQERARWDRTEQQDRGATGETLLDAVGQVPAPGSGHSTTTSEPPPDPGSDEEIDWGMDSAMDFETSPRVPCVFLWCVGEDSAKVLPRDARVLVATGDLVREREACQLLPEDRVILGPTSERWSPAEEFTSAVLAAARRENQELVDTAREWRCALSRLAEARRWGAQQVRDQLAAVGVERQVQTVLAWLDIETPSPIGPRDVPDELIAMWPLIADHTTRDRDQVVKACLELRSLSVAAGRALINLWGGRRVDIGVDQGWLADMVATLRDEVQVYEVAEVQFAAVPEAMLGWWTSAAVASQLAALEEGGERAGAASQIGERL